MQLKSFGEQRGQAVVEMTLGFLLFLTVFFAIVEFSHLLYTKVTLQHALRTAGRYMVTGITGLDGGGNPIPRDQMIHDVFCANVFAAGVVCPSLGPNFQFTCLDPPPPVACSGGASDQTVMVTINLTKRALTPLFVNVFPVGGFPFQLSTTWKNEPFGTS